MAKKIDTTKQIEHDSPRPKSAILIGESAILERDEKAVELRLASAWADYGEGPISHALGCADVMLTKRAEKADDRDWIDSIRNELNDLPQFLPQGSKTRDQMIAAAVSTVAEQGDTEEAILAAAEGLRHEAAMRYAKPLWDWLKELRTMAEKFTDPKDALFLKLIAADLQRRIGPIEVAALTALPDAPRNGCGDDSVVGWPGVSDAIAAELVDASRPLARNRDLLAKKVHAEMMRRSDGGDRTVRKRGGKLVPAFDSVIRRGLPNYGTYGKK